MPDPIAPETPPKVEGNEPVVAPEAPPEEPVIPEEAPPEVPPEAPPVEMSLEEKRDHDLRSWIGRRDAELRTEMEARQQAILTEIQKAGATPAGPAETPDPGTDADAWFDHKYHERETAQTTFTDSLVKAGTAILQQDELVKDDPELGKEIFQEIQQGRVLVDRTLPAEKAAAFAIASAKSNVLTRRIMKKANPLQGNTPNVVPVGGITPPPAPAKPAVKLPEMSDYAKAAAKRFGMTDEQVLKVLK